MQQLKSKTGLMLDVAIIVIVMMVPILYLGGYLTLDMQGFYCDDRSIRYPVMDPSFKVWSQIAIILVMPISVCLIVEVLVSPDDQPLQIRIRRALHVYVAYLYCIVCEVYFFCIVKFSVSELRPNFLDSCKPDFSNINCSAGYVNKYSCTSGLSEVALVDKYTSFPSGHAFTSFVMATFLTLYLHNRLDGRPTPLTVSILNLTLVALATVISMSRITSYQHHWWDVVVGVVAGIAIGAYGFHIFLFKTGVPLFSKTLLQKPNDNNVEHTTLIHNSRTYETDQ